MNRRTILIALVWLSFFGALFSCVKVDEFEMPDLEWEESEIVSNSNLQALASIVDQSEEGLVRFGEDDEAIVSGYVISSDEAGSFYKTLIVQDQVMDAEQGIQIRIDLKSYFTKFKFGRKIFIKLAGLTATKEKGNYVLGYLLKDQVVDIPASIIDKKLIRSEGLSELTGTFTRLEEISEADLNTFVRIENLQFSSDDLGATYAGEVYDRYIAKRLLESCENGSSIWLQSSVYTDYRSLLVPVEKINIEGVVTQDSYSGEIILMVNDLGDISTIEGKRCDPEYFICAEKEEVGQKIIFYEDFDQLSSTRDLQPLGWFNLNINYGNGKFKKRSSNENVFLQISAYNSGESTMEVWLVSPPIDLDQSVNEVLSFKTRATFDEGRILKVWISNDFNSDVKTTTWKQLEAKISRGSRDASNDRFESSGSISLDCFEGEVRIGFQYTGSDPGRTTTYDIDNFLILGSK